MSDFQLGLLVFGALVIVGVLGFNWWQERSHRKRAEQAFDLPPRDILFEQEGASSEAAPVPPMPSAAATVEEDDWAASPMTEAAPARMEAAPPPAVTGPEASPVECSAEFRRAEAFNAVFLDELTRVAGGLGRPVRISGFDDMERRWQLLDESADGRFRHLRAALLLADRQAVTSHAELEAFVSQMAQLAQDAGAEIDVPDVASMDKRAQELDSFCGEVDIAIGLSVVARSGQVFQGTSIRALAESNGLRLRADGIFHGEDAAGQTEFTLDNQAAEPFFPDSIKGLTTTGITFLLDVPRASGGIASYDRMVQLARRFAESLDGFIVDDNRRPLDDNGLSAIRKLLAGVYVTMEQAGIPAGGDTANRLFS
jgi:FtsZ-interacting cell division protein ZipA